MSIVESFLSMVTDINTRIDNIGKKVIALREEIDPEKVDNATDKILPQMKGLNTRIESLARDLRISKAQGAPSEFTNGVDDYVSNMQQALISIHAILSMVRRDVRARLTHTKG